MPLLGRVEEEGLASDGPILVRCFVRETLQRVQDDKGGSFLEPRLDAHESEELLEEGGEGGRVVKTDACSGDGVETEEFGKEQLFRIDGIFFAVRCLGGCGGDGAEHFNRVQGFAGSQKLGGRRRMGIFQSTRGGLAHDAERKLRLQDRSPQSKPSQSLT